MNSVSPRTDMTSVSGLHGNQTLANMSSPSDTAIEAYVVPWGWVALYAITTLIVILGNGLVIVAVFRYQFLQTLTNTFVVGVAAIDLSSSSTGWMKIADLIWPNSMAGYGPCLIRQTVGSINGVGSASLLLCIACERCIGTFMPLRYPQIITTSRVRVALLLSITLPVVVILPGFALSNRWQGDLPCLYFVVFPPWLSCVTCGWVLFCIVFMMGAYLCILHTTMKLQQRVASVDASSTAGQSHQSNLKAVKNLFTVVILFTVCLGPYCIVTLFVTFDRFRFLQNTTVMRMYVGLLIMFLFNSLVNPIIYAVRFKSFTVAFKLMFGLIKDEDKFSAIENAKGVTMAK